MNSSTSSIFICTNTDNLSVGCATTRCSEIFVSLLERLEIYVDFFFYFSFFVPEGRTIKCRFWWRYLILDIHVKNDVKDVSLTSLNITGAAFLILFSDKTFRCSWSSHIAIIQIMFVFNRSEHDTVFELCYDEVTFEGNY